MSSIKKKIAEGLLYSSVNNVVIKIFAAIGFFLIIKHLSLADYGTFALLVSWTGPVSSIVLFSFDRIFVSNFAAARGRGDLARMKGLLKEYYSLCLILIVVFFSAIILLRHIVLGFYDSYILQYFWLTLLFITSQLLMNLTSLFLEAHSGFKEISFMESFESVSRTVVIIVSFFFLPFSVSFLLIVYTIAKLAATLVGLFYFSIPYLSSFTHKVPAERKVLMTIFKDFGKWEIATNILNQLGQPLKLSIIKFFVNIEAVAVYDFARNVYSAISSFLPVKQVIFPAVAHSVEKPHIVSLIVTKARKYLLLAYVFIYGAVILFSPIVIALAFPQYKGNLLVIYIINLHLFIDVYKIGQDALVYAFKEQRFVFATTVPFMLLQTASDIIFISLFGLVGTAISWNVGALLTAYFTDIYLLKKDRFDKFSWKDFWSFDSYDRLILKQISTKFKQLFRLNKQPIAP